MSAQPARRSDGIFNHYNHRRPHQALMNFTPSYVHQINNKTLLCQEREAL